MRTALFVVVACSTAALADPPKPKLTSQAATLKGKACKTTEGQNGEDGLTLCAGPDGYRIRLFFSAENSYASFEKGEFSAQVGGLTLGKIEWRLADGKPFAVVAEVTVHPSEGSKQKVTRYVVRGLDSHAALSTDETTHAKALAAADATLK